MTKRPTNIMQCVVVSSDWNGVVVSQTTTASSSGHFTRCPLPSVQMPTSFLPFLLSNCPTISQQKQRNNPNKKQQQQQQNEQQYKHFDSVTTLIILLSTTVCSIDSGQHVYHGCQSNHCRLLVIHAP